MSPLKCQTDPLQESSGPGVATDSDYCHAHTSRVDLVYRAVSLRVKGVYLLSPAAFKAAVSICRMTPTCVVMISCFTCKDGILRPG